MRASCSFDDTPCTIPGKAGLQPAARHRPAKPRVACRQNSHQPDHGRRRVSATGCRAQTFLEYLVGMAGRRTVEPRPDHRNLLGALAAPGSAGHSATAASMALPPFFITFAPIWAAKGLCEATIACCARTGSRQAALMGRKRAKKSKK